MDDLVKKLDAKVLTAAGGIIIALALTVVVYQITVNRVDAIVGGLQQLNSDMRSDAQDIKAEKVKLNETLTELRKAITDQSQATRDLQVYIRQNR